ncbi:MAG TPA: DUF4349 domain-containing protein [Thermoanaerobaculia bacterium]|jgi:hypothetical protein|nr:DUF4349 domain-containing protein [Thermoanaerobaculia bacterium]
MRGFLILVLAGCLLGAGGCKKERPAGIVTVSAGESRAAQPQDMKALGYVGGDSRSAPAPPKPSAPPPPPPAKGSPAIPRKLLRTVDLQLEVKDSVDVAKRVEALVNGMGGYVSSSNAQRQGELFVYSLTLRVPSERFDQVLNSLRSFAVRVNREHQQVEDVTDQYIDLDAHRRTLAETENELRGLLAESRQKGRKADEIMEIYRQLVDIRTQIEQIQTQLSSYDKLAALSTINLELIPTEAAKPVADQSWQPADTLRASIRKLIDFLQWLVDFLIFAAIVLVPVGLAILVGFLVLRWLWRRLGRPFRRVRRVSPQAAPPPAPPPGGGAAVP